MEKRKTINTIKKKMSSYQWLWGRKDEEMEHGEFLGKCNSFVWFSNGEYVILHLSKHRVYNIKNGL
jgi:hypothetical protein